jgi:tetratricopeptide (TPR) repeat protein
MKTLLLAVVLCLSPGGDRERGLQLYRDGKFAEAVTAFRAAVEQDGDSAELQWNLALAAWRAGDLPTAETAAEKYAALAKDARKDLHAGLLGAVRHDEALALSGKGDELLAAAAATPNPAAPPAGQPEDPLPVFEQALQKATQARDHFVRGAEAGATPELVRNTERALRTIDELQQKIDELKKQREQQKKQDEQKKDDEQKKPEDKKDEPKSDEKKDDDKGEKKDEPKPDQKPPEGDEKGDEKADEKQGDKPKSEPESKGEGEEKPEPKGQGDKPEPKPPEGQDQKPDPQQGKGDEAGTAGEKSDQGAPSSGKPRGDAPGEAGQATELTPEQAQRLLEKLKQTDEKQKAFRARAKLSRPPVERDW